MSSKTHRACLPWKQLAIVFSCTQGINVSEPLNQFRNLYWAMLSVHELTYPHIAPQGFDTSPHALPMQGFIGHAPIPKSLEDAQALNQL